MVRQAVRVRVLERLLLELFDEGSLFGTVHTCLGQEFCAAALHPHLKPGQDAFFATHRGHGHYLCHGGPPEDFLSELMGREGALCNGCGGTQNLAYKRFFSAGIQGGSAPIGVGYAWAMARRGEKNIAVVQIGDGTLGEGTLYEAFTFAALLKAPVLFLLEVNGWAQSTDTSQTTPGDLVQRAAGFGLRAHRTSDSDPELLWSQLRDVVAQVRQGVPTLQIVDTRRLAAHSKGDDDRSPAYLAKMEAEDPLTRLIAESPQVRDMVEEAVRDFREIAEIVKSRSLLEAEVLHRSTARLVVRSEDLTPGDEASLRGTESLNRALDELLGESKQRVLLGEDLLDPYGGTFKVSRGLSTRYPDQVFSTPIAEAGMVGLANGLAMAGAEPIVEMMFADFVTLATDQLVNFAAKFRQMYAQKVSCPLTLRLPSGGGRGYGPTHSQCLEYLFFGIPGIRVVAMSHRHDSGALLKHVVRNQSTPTLFVEHKGLYSSPSLKGQLWDLEWVPTVRDNGGYPPLYYRAQKGERGDVTLVTYGGTAGIVEQAMRHLVEEEELRFELIILTQIWPLEAEEVITSVQRTRRLVVVEEGNSDYGVGGALAGLVAESIGGSFQMRRVGSMPVPLPCARQLEDAVLPSVERIRAAILGVL
jgi:2-oxoisovalerate dehydrogenase E1 component